MFAVPAGYIRAGWCTVSLERSVNIAAGPWIVAVSALQRRSAAALSSPASLAAGYYCPLPTEQLPCPPGEFSPNPGATSCLVCSDGTFQPVGANAVRKSRHAAQDMTQTSCPLCPAGMAETCSHSAHAPQGSTARSRQRSCRARTASTARLARPRRPRARRCMMPRPPPARPAPFSSASLPSQVAVCLPSSSVRVLTAAQSACW